MDNSVEFTQSVINYPNGQIKEQYYIGANGMRFGLYTSYHENGAICVRTNYFNEQLHGDYLEFADNGNVVERRQFIYGTRSGLHETFWPGSRVLKVICYYNQQGQLDGSLIVYDQQGFVVQNLYYLNGVQQIDAPSHVVFNQQLQQILSRMNIQKLSAQCSICLAEDGLRDCYTTPCNHHYCVDCLTTWLRDSKVCPNCRMNLSSE